MSKTCLNCGKFVEDENIAYCPSCGNPMGQKGYQSSMLTAAYVFMIISCVLIGWTLIPLAWMIPMTIKIHKRMKDCNESLGVGFKICTLIFASLISGILLLCDSEA